VDRTSAGVGLRALAAAVLLVALIAVPASPAAPVAAPAPIAAHAGVGPGFGDGGLVETPFRPSGDDFATALALQADEHVVVAAAAGGDFGLARFNEYLYEINPIGIDGKTITDFAGGDDVARAVTVTAGGAILAAGSSRGDVAVARYDSTGILDRSFDGDGRLTVDLGQGDDSAYAVISMADGRALVIGGSSASVSVLRLLADGRPDVSYGTAGRVTLASSGPGRAAALQPDGKLVVAGGGDRLVVHRLLADGAVDPAFGAGGMASVAVGGAATANALALAPDGAILLAGTTQGDIVAARLLPAGAVDPSFGLGGTTILDLGGDEAAYGLARRDNGALLVVGDAGERGLIVRYRPDGSIESSFGSGGVVITRPSPIDGSVPRRFRAVLPHPDEGWIVAGSLGPDALVARVYEPSGYPGGPAVDFGDQRQVVVGSAVQADGKVVVAAYNGGEIGLVRYNPDGTRDSSFGVSGVVVFDGATNPQGVVIQPSGRIVVAATTWRSPAQVSLVGFRPDGTLDTRFGIDGRADVDIGTWSQLPTGLLGDADGRLLLAAANADGPVLARLTPEGQLDPSYGQGGLVVRAIPPHQASNSSIRTMALQADGGLVVVSSAAEVIRFGPTGNRDLGFGGDGAVTFPQWELGDPSALAVQPDGRILVAGSTSPYNDGGITLMRLRSDGSADPTWQRRPVLFRGGAYNERVPSRPSTVTVMGDGRILVGGEASTSLALVRLQPDGTHDTTFGVDAGLLLPVWPGTLPVLVHQTESDGILAVASNGNSAWPRRGVLLARVASGPLGAPTGVTAVAGGGSARVTWSRPPLFDESPIQGYRIDASDGVHSTTTSDATSRSAVVPGLTAGEAYTFTVRAVRAGGLGPPSAASNAIVPGPTPSGLYHPVAPERILDTRVGIGGSLGPVGPGGTIGVRINGLGGVPPTGASAVALNLTATQPTAEGFVTVYPSGTVRATTSSLNFLTGQTVANLVVAKIGTDGTVAIYNNTGSTHLVADVTGWYGAEGAAEGARYTGVVPDRVLDTRTDMVSRGPVGAGTTTEVAVVGVGGVPQSGASAVVLNLTVTAPSAEGFLTVFPAGGPRPNASSLNFRAGQTVANLVFAKVGAGGKVAIYNHSGSAQIVVDVMGWYGADGAPDGARYNGIVPSRLLDTRSGTGGSWSAVGPGGTVDLRVTGVGGVPASGVSAVAVNVTVTQPTAEGFLTVFPTGSTRTNTSSVNFLPGQTVANLSVAKVGAGGAVSIYNFTGRTHVVVDVVGWFGP